MRERCFHFVLSIHYIQKNSFTCYPSVRREFFAWYSTVRGCDPTLTLQEGEGWLSRVHGHWVLGIFSSCWVFVCLFLICKLDGFPNQFFKKSALLALVPMFLREEEYCQCVCHLKFYILWKYLVLLLLKNFKMFLFCDFSIIFLQFLW